jgi:mannose-6-phosphate isomerase-like protein (cupin superfamily)
MFLAMRGSFRLEFRDRILNVQEGEFVIVPRGVEHRPVAETEAEILLFEPAEVRNTGNIFDEKFTAPGNVRI